MYKPTCFYRILSRRGRDAKATIYISSRCSGCLRDLVVTTEGESGTVLGTCKCASCGGARFGFRSRLVLFQSRVFGSVYSQYTNGRWSDGTYYRIRRVCTPKVFRG